MGRTMLEMRSPAAERLAAFRDRPKAPARRRPSREGLIAMRGPSLISAATEPALSDQKPHVFTRFNLPTGATFRGLGEVAALARAEGPSDVTAAFDLVSRILGYTRVDIPYAVDCLGEAYASQVEEIVVSRVSTYSCCDVACDINVPVDTAPVDEGLEVHSRPSSYLRCDVAFDFNCPVYLGNLSGDSTECRVSSYVRHELPYSIDCPGHCPGILVDEGLEVHSRPSSYLRCDVAFDFNCPVYLGNLSQDSTECRVSSYERHELPYSIDCPGHCPGLIVDEGLEVYSRPCSYLLRDVAFDFNCPVYLGNLSQDSTECRVSSYVRHELPYSIDCPGDCPGILVDEGVDVNSRTSTYLRCNIPFDFNNLAIAIAGQ